MFIRANKWQDRRSFLLKKYHCLFDKEISAFINCNFIEQEIGNVFNQNLLRLKFDQYRGFKYWENSLKRRRGKQLDAIKSMRFSEEKREDQKLIKKL